MSQLMAMRKSIQGVFKKRGDGVGVSAQSRGEEGGGAYYKNLCSKGSVIHSCAKNESLNKHSFVEFNNCEGQNKCST